VSDSWRADGPRIYFGKDGDRLVILIGGGAGMLGRVQTKKETGDSIMPLTHDFKETIRARAQRDPDFRQALLRGYVNATVGFQDLEKRTQIPAKSPMRMLGPKGSPSAANLSSILTALQKTEGVQFELSLRR